MHKFDWDTEHKKYALANKIEAKDYTSYTQELVFSDSCTPFNLHKPYIDSIKLKSPKTGNTLTRISEVLDVWMDSGSMPYAQVHFPFAGFEDTSIRKAETDVEKQACLDLIEDIWKEKFGVDFQNRPGHPYETTKSDFYNSTVLYFESENTILSAIQISKQKKENEYIPLGSTILQRVGTLESERGK